LQAQAAASPLSTLSTQQQAPNQRADDTAQTLQAELNRRLYAAANHTAHTEHREPPKLSRGRDGNLRYESSSFSAVILSDGQVEFSDVALPVVDPPQFQDYPPELAASYIELIKRIQKLIKIRLPFPDLTDLVARISDHDPYAAEKRWFLRETNDVRSKLVATHNDEAGREATQRIVTELTSIIRNAKLNVDQKRAAVFGVWDSCDGDADGKWHRVVESFVRESMPRDSNVGYSPALLVSLNRKRVSRRAFAPYVDDHPAVHQTATAKQLAAPMSR
jgi:hypothetical protein